MAAATAAGTGEKAKEIRKDSGQNEEPQEEVQRPKPGTLNHQAARMPGLRLLAQLGQLRAALSELVAPGSRV